MNESFWPCSGCARHVKRGDATCPFCGVGNPARMLASTAKASAENEATRTIAGRLSRAALFAGTVGAAIAVTDCGNTAAPPYGQGPPPPPDDASLMQGAADSASGSSDSPSASSASDASDASEAASPTPGPTAQPVYGAPVPLYGGSPIRFDE